MNNIKAIETYFEFMKMNGSMHIFKTAKKIGILDTLGAKPLTLSELADFCEIQEDAAGLFLDCLCELNITIFENGCYKLSDAMMLISGQYSNLSNEYWQHLPEYLKTGEPIVKMDSIEQSEQQYIKQVNALGWMLKPAAQKASSILEISKEISTLDILDIGAGSAVWSIAIACQNKNAHITAVDWPAILDIAESNAGNHLGKEQFQKLPGNYHDIDLPSDSYNIAIAGNITHLETSDGNIAIMKKLYNSLKKEGKIIIFDILPENSKGKLACSLYTLGLALRTQHGHVYTKNEIKHFLSHVGFKNFKAIPIDTQPYTMGMFIAQK